MYEKSETLSLGGSLEVEQHLRRYSFASSSQYKIRVKP
jgi:hypothetical protein